MAALAFLVVVSLLVAGDYVIGVLLGVCGIIIVLVISAFVVLKLFTRVVVICWGRLFDI